MRRVPLLFLALLNGACAYYPRQVEVYDPDCQIVSRKMVLQEADVGYYVGISCQNEGCLIPLIPAAASAIVSGSIVVVGNVVYWLEKQGRCLPHRFEDRPPP